MSQGGDGRTGDRGEEGDPGVREETTCQFGLGGWRGRGRTGECEFQKEGYRRRTEEGRCSGPEDILEEFGEVRVPRHFKQKEDEPLGSAGSRVRETETDTPSSVSLLCVPSDP